MVGKTTFIHPLPIIVMISKPDNLIVRHEDEAVKEASACGYRYRLGTMIHIPPGVVHGAVGKMRILVVDIPDIDDSDVYYV